MSINNIFKCVLDISNEDHALSHYCMVATVGTEPVRSWIVLVRVMTKKGCT
jgi:hypothetical protein